jgi:hypothetical protein
MLYAKGRTDGRTDGHNAANGHFPQLLYEYAETHCIFLAPVVFVFCVIRTNIDYFPNIINLYVGILETRSVYLALRTDH